MLSKEIIGQRFAQTSAEVEAGRLRFFAKSIGETDPIYTDVQAALTAGYINLPCPPTFLFCLKMDQPNPFARWQDLGIDLSMILHANQKFTYHQPAVAGDRLTFSGVISDYYVKKNGALEFIVEQTKVVNQRDEHVADLSVTLVVRHPKERS